MEETVPLTIESIRDVKPLSRYFKLSESRRELIKTRQRERYKNSPERQRRRMYPRAVSKGLIRNPRKLGKYSEYGNILRNEICWHARNKNVWRFKWPRRVRVESTRKPCSMRGAMRTLDGRRRRGGGREPSAHARWRDLVAASCPAPRRRCPEVARCAP